MRSFGLVLATLAIAVYAAPKPPTTTTSSTPVAQITCRSQTYTYNELAGYGYIPGTSRDKYGDTIGGIGSSIALKSWHKRGHHYKGTLYTVPDRGWNTNGTINFIPRVHRFGVKLTPKSNATVASPSAPNLEFTYEDTVLLRGPDGTFATGLDADVTGHISFAGFPDLPIATYTGDGFGGAGPGGKAIPIDAEGIVLAEDGNFWISDEYGPYVYKFNSDGKMIAAIRSVDAILPVRNGTVSFSADSPPHYNPKEVITPPDPTHGRSNNQGFEGLTASPDGKYLYALLQSAAMQEGGLNSATRRYTRLVQYEIGGGHYSHDDGRWKRGSNSFNLVAEYVVPLPVYTTSANKTKVAAQSDIHYISPTQFLILPRDSGAGHGQSSSTSLYRHADIFDISNATNVMGTAHDGFNSSIASSTGVLNPGITPATFCTFLDYNINAQLNRFGVHNGGNQDQYLLNEKWESFALAPVDGSQDDCDGNDQYYLFSLSDDDFITQDGKFKTTRIRSTANTNRGLQAILTAERYSIRMLRVITWTTRHSSSRSRCREGRSRLLDE
jgi:hypothetical protein